MSVLEKTSRKDPADRKVYETLEEEYALINALIEARGFAGLTQAQLARRMKTTQSTVARLEGGKSWPSTRTLLKFAAATGTKLIISFEPSGRRGGRA